MKWTRLAILVHSRKEVVVAGVAVPRVHGGIVCILEWMHEMPLDCLLPRFHDLWIVDDSEDAVRCYENTQHRVHLQHESLEHNVVVLLSIRDKHPAQ